MSSWSAQGVYLGTLVWDNNYPSVLIDDYTWTKVKGEDGVDGTNGTDGRGITSITEYYLATSSSSGITTSTSGWTTTVQAMTSTNKYLWNYEIVTYTDNTTAQTIPHIIGVYGDKGNDGTNGTNGNDGKGITSITNYYLATSASSGVTRSTSGWTTTVQTVTNTNKYLWNYEDILYTDNTHTYTTPHVIGVYGDKGNDGTNGTNGNDGRGITSITEYYLATSSSSGVTRSTSGWTTTVQTVTNTNKYLWNYEDILFTDNTHTYTTPHVIGVYGDKGAQGDSVQGADAEYYDFLPVKEIVQVSRAGVLSINLQYNILHIKGATTETVTASKSGYWIRFNSDANNAYYELSVGNTSPNYANGNFMTNYHLNSSHPTYITVYLVKGTSATVVNKKVIPVIYAQGALFDIDADLNQISSTVQGHTTTITTLQNTLDNVDVGGRNYARNTSGEWSEWVNFTNVNNQTVRVCDDTYIPADKEVGEQWTSQIIIEFQNVTASGGGTFRISAQSSVDNSWDMSMIWKYTMLNTTTVPEDGVYKYVNTDAITQANQSSVLLKPMIRIDYATGKMRWKCVKIEKGNVATDWTPAPEDINNSITTVSNNVSQITQTMNSISSTVSSHTTSINNINNSISEMSDDISSVTQTANNIALEVSHLESETLFADKILGGTFFEMSDNESGQSVSYNSTTKIYRMSQTNSSQDIDYGNNWVNYTINKGNYLLYFTPTTSSTQKVTYYINAYIRDSEGNALNTYNIITLSNSISQTGKPQLIEIEVPQDNCRFHFYVESPYTSGIGSNWWVQIEKLRLTIQTGSDSLFKMTSESITSTVSNQQLQIDNLKEDEKNLFKHSSYGGGEINDGNKWEFIDNGIEYTFESWDKYNMVFIDGECTWSNEDDGSTYVYSPYVWLNSSAYTLNCYFNFYDAKNSIELLKYTNLTDALNMNTPSAAYYIKRDGTLTTTATYNIYLEQIEDVIVFTAPAPGYYRIRFGNHQSNYDSENDNNIELSWVKLYAGNHIANDFLEWNTGFSKAFSKIEQTANEISFQVNDISLRLNGINNEIELNGDTKINGSLTLNDETQGFLLTNPDGTTQLSPQSIGTYDNFKNRTVKTSSVAQNQTGALYENYGNNYYSTTIDLQYNIGSLSSGTLITLKNQVTSYSAQTNNGGIWTLTPTYTNITYKLYEGNTLKHSKTVSSSSAASITSYTTSATAVITLKITMNLRFSKSAIDNIFNNPDNSNYMEVPHAKAIIGYDIELPSASFMLIGYDGLAVNFGNQKTAFFSGDNTIIQYGNYGFKVSTSGLQKWNGTSWVGLNNKNIKTISSNYTLTEADDFIIFNGSSSDATLTLPINLSMGKMIYVKDIGANQLTVSCAGRIYQQSSRSLSDSVSFSDRMHFFIWNGNYWFMGYCG